jgi:hypothetical protein
MSTSSISSLEGIRLYLRRKKTLTELKTIADSLSSVDPAEFETVLTNLGFGSSNASGVVRGIDRFQVLQLVEGLIAEMIAAGVTAWTEAQSGSQAINIMQRVDFSTACARN